MRRALAVSAAGMLVAELAVMYVIHQVSWMPDQERAALDGVLLVVVAVPLLHATVLRPLRDSEARLRAIVEAAGDGIIVISSTGTVESINPSAESMFGVAAADVLGHNVKELIPPPVSDEHDSYLARYRATGERRVIGQRPEVVGRRKDGTTFPIELSVSEVHLGKELKFTGIVRDITERKRAEEALRESEERYRATFQHLHDVLFKTDANGILTMVSPSVQKLLGYTPEGLLGANVRNFYADTTEADTIHELVLSGKAIEDREAIFVRQDGSTVTVSLAASLIFGEGQDRVAVQGTVRDISARKLAEEERDRYFDMSLDALAVIDKDMRFQRVNSAWERVLGFTREEMLGRTPVKFSLPEDRPLVIAAALETMEGRTLEDRRTRFLTRGGEVRWLSWNSTPVINGVSYSVVRDVTDQVRAQDEQEEMMAILQENAFVLNEQAAELDALRAEAEYAANHDMLTGLFNRRAWFNVAIANRGSCVALVDIDYFKRINDRWGHPAGDAVLAEVARRLEASLGADAVLTEVSRRFREPTTGAVLGRVGGEEFAILFQGPVAAARQACTTAMAAFDAPIQLPNGEEIVVSLSAGLAAWRRGRSTREDALARTYEAADQALYAAKEGGRARLVVSEGRRAA